MSVFRLKKKSDDELKQITDEVIAQVTNQTDLRIYKIIMYGSYARGTADDESDIDIMILCDNDENQVEVHRDELRRIVDRVGYEHDIFVQAKVRGIGKFNYWADTLPFYKNINDEGIVLYG